MKPNVRYSDSPIGMPSLYSEAVSDIVLVIDTSGSVMGYRDLLSKFISEMKDIATLIKTPIRVLHVDTCVNLDETIEPNDDREISPRGGGGTCFRPAFNLLCEEGTEPKALIYFTDGECWSYPEFTPDYPVLWAKWGGYNFKPPFGEVVEVADEDDNNDY
jgi:predicted metal-dependent peptidase